MRCRGCQRDVVLGTGERVHFSDTCPGCGADLHSCLHCARHDPSAYNECRESSAEVVRDRDRGNRCEYFRPRESEGDGPGATSERDRALADLDALFKKR